MIWLNLKKCLLDLNLLKIWRNEVKDPRTGAMQLILSNHFTLSGELDFLLYFIGNAYPACQ